jgi:hypothetical protein
MNLNLSRHFFAQQPLLKKGICALETMRDEISSEVAGRVGDTPIHERLGDTSRNAILSEC